MATAKRRQLDKVWVPNTRTETHETAMVHFIDGKETDRISGGVTRTLVDTSRYEQPPDRIVLDLSIAEAETLRLLLHRCVSGNENTRRSYTNAIDRALSEAYVSVPEEKVRARGVSAGVHFLAPVGPSPAQDKASPVKETPSKLDQLRRELEQQRAAQQAAKCGGVPSSQYRPSYLGVPRG